MRRCQGMRIAVCDDEALFREALHAKILQDGFAHDYETDVEEYGSGRALLDAQEKGYSADVYFLDVQMDQGTDDGIRTARELRRRGERGLIIYVTAYLDYAQMGYEVRAFRYLLKNQIHDKLFEVLRDVRQELSGQDFFFKAGGENIRIDRRGILYLESRLRMLRLVTKTEEYVFYAGLEDVQRQLGEEFLRCHKSFLVNLEKVVRFSKEQIVLEDGTNIPISRSYAKNVRQRLLLEMK
ncbi:DNA-binding response regulator [bacterium D16-50]|nr:DNA-binding response regulator [bacterium D16-50]